MLSLPDAGGVAARQLDPILQRQYSAFFKDTDWGTSTKAGNLDTPQNRRDFRIPSQFWVGDYKYDVFQGSLKNYYGRTQIDLMGVCDATFYWTDTKTRGSFNAFFAQHLIVVHLAIGCFLVFFISRLGRSDPSSRILQCNCDCSSAICVYALYGQHDPGFACVVKLPSLRV